MLAIPQSRSFAHRRLNHGRLVLRFETLEGRDLLTVFTVINTNSSGPGSLAQAITDSNNATGPNVIDFSIGSGPQVISIPGTDKPSGIGIIDTLPQVTHTVTIDGTTQPGYAGKPLIELDGESTANIGLNIDAPDCVVRGLSIMGVDNGGQGTAFPTGLFIDAPSSNTLVENNAFGTDAYGDAGYNGQNMMVSSATDIIRNNYFVTGEPQTTIASRSSAGGQTTATANLWASQNSTWTVKFYDDTLGRTYLGSTTVTVTARPTSFSKTFNQTVPSSDAISATETDSNGNIYAFFPGDILDGSANGLYVAAVFHDVLGRAPDSGGLAYWTAQLDSGVPVSSVAEAIAHSAEYYANFVIKLDYVKLLGRPADDAGVAYWTAQMQNGLTDQQLEGQLAASDEFFNSAGGNANQVNWIDAVYKLLLGRTADSSGETYWNAQLTTLLKSEDAIGARLQVALGIAGSQENNTNLINADYFHYLGRAADSGGLAYWLGQFAAGQTNEDVIAGFTGSAEYYQEHTQ